MHTQMMLTSALQMKIAVENATRFSNCSCIAVVVCVYMAEDFGGTPSPEVSGFIG